MDIEKGFEIENLSIFLPWGIHRTEMHQLLKGLGLVQRERDFYTMNCVSMGGISDEIGLHTSNKHGHLYEISFYHYQKQAPKELFKKFQEHLEATFGRPTGCGQDSEFSSSKWEFKDGWIQHYVVDRAKLAGRKTGFEHKATLINFAALHKKREWKFTTDTPIDAILPAIPAEPSSPMITVLAALAFRKHRCENTPLT